jgi:hypothetical protein
MGADETPTLGWSGAMKSGAAAAAAISGADRGISGVDSVSSALPTHYHDSP